MSDFVKSLFDTGANDTKTDTGLLLLRLGSASFLLFAHGWSKFWAFSEKAATFADPIGLGPTLSFTLVVFAEFFCTIAIMAGFATRLAAIPPIIAMLVAAFIRHAADPFAKQELPLLYAFMFLTLIFTGAGKFSLDKVIFNKFRRRTVTSNRPVEVNAR